ncbi:MAG: phosphodiester glycosidase family protein, partial [Neisseria elongata]
MAVSSEIRKTGIYIGDGATSRYPFKYKVLSVEYISVVVSDGSGEDKELAHGRDYEAVIARNQDIEPGGYIDLKKPLPRGHRLVIVSNQDYLQPTVLTNHGGFYPTVLNAALDRLTIQIQQLSENVERSLKVGVITPENVSLNLPTPYPNKGLAWNAEGTGLTNTDFHEQAAASAERAEDAVRQAENEVKKVSAALSGLKTVPTFASIDLLRQAVKGDSPAAIVSSYHEGQQVGGGIFIADLKDKASADDGYNVIVDVAGARWKRIRGVGDVVNFETRARFVASATKMSELPDGLTVFAGGYQYIKDAASQYIPDLPGWLPINESFGHFDDTYTESNLPTIVRCRYRAEGGKRWNITEVINPRPGCVKKILLGTPDEQKKIKLQKLHEYVGGSRSRILLSCDGWTTPPVDGKAALQGLQIVDGKVHRDWDTSDYDTNAAAVWLRNGKLKAAKSKDGKSAAKWVEEGAEWTASFARGPVLVEDGRVIPNADTYLSARAAIGQRADRSLVFLNLEGVSGSYGATLQESAQIMADEGCLIAVALDAGGSSQVWYGDAYACPSSDESFQTGRAIPSAIEIIADIIEPYDTGWIPVAAVAGVTAGSDAQGGAAIAYRQTGKQIEMRLDVVAELKTNKELIITSESMPQRFLSKDYRPIRGMASGFGGALVPWWSGTYISLLPQKNTPYAYG